jgi:hypothetical protein
MKSKILLRIAFGVIIFHLLGHTVGHFTWKETDDAVMAEIIRSMDEHQFEFMGKMQSIGGNHEGYSFLFGITMIMFAALTWMISGKIETTHELNPVLVVMGIALALFGITELVYFFPLAGGSSLLAGILLLVGWMRAKTI